MKQPTKRQRNDSLSENTIITIVLMLIGMGLLLVITLGALLLRRAMGGQPLGLIPSAPPTAIIEPAFVPTADCSPPTLAVGGTRFQIQSITPGPDGSLTAPLDTPGIAYWVQGTNTNYVFVLSNTSENLSLMSTITAGSSAELTLPNCNVETQSLAVPEAGVLNTATLPDQSIPGITIFFQTDASGNGFATGGKLTGGQASAGAIPSPTVESALAPATANTLPPVVENVPAPVIENTQPPSVENIPPPSGDVLAEITLLEGIASDGTNIRVGVSILNYGSNALTLSVNDVSLTPEGGAALGLVNSEPALPRSIGPGATETVYFTFPRPSSQIATLRIFMIEFDIEGY